MEATTGREERDAGLGPELLAVAVRRQAVASSWLDNIGRLLRGQPIRNEVLEQAAVDAALAQLLERARAVGASDIDRLSLAIAVEGHGGRRAVTVALAGRPVRGS